MAYENKTCMFILHKLSQQLKILHYNIKIILYSSRESLYSTLCGYEDNVHSGEWFWLLLS